MPRFAVLLHDGPRGPHWDLLLETGPSLATWALAREPNALGPIDAQRLADHRVEYLEHEGPVSGNRGFVTRWDDGDYRLVRQSDREMVLVFEGNRLLGEARLVQSSNDVRQWLFELTPCRTQKD